MKKLVAATLILASGALLNAQTAPPITVTLLGTGVPLLNAVGYAKSGRVTTGSAHGRRPLARPPDASPVKVDRRRRAGAREPFAQLLQLIVFRRDVSIDFR